MRRLTLIVLIALFITLSNRYSCYAQEPFKVKTIEFGYSVFYNYLNEIHLASDQMGENDLEQRMMAGYDLKVSFATKNPNIDLLAGVITCDDPSYSSVSASNSHTNDFGMEEINGGGVYGGLRMKTPGKHFGANLELCLVSFSFKQNYTHYYGNEEKFGHDYFFASWNSYI